MQISWSACALLCCLSSQYQGGQVSHKEHGLQTQGLFLIRRSVIDMRSVLVKPVHNCATDVNIDVTLTYIFFFSFQIEECAIQDLLIHYEAFDNPDEYVTVERAPQGPMAAPTWNKH